MTDWELRSFENLAYSAHHIFTTSSIRMNNETLGAMVYSPHTENVLLSLDITITSNTITSI